MMWRLDPKIREKVKQFDAKPFFFPVNEGGDWRVEIGLSRPPSKVARYDDGSHRQFESDDAAWAWIEANLGDD